MQKRNTFMPLPAKTGWIGMGLLLMVRTAVAKGPSPSKVCAAIEDRSLSACVFH